MVRMEKAKTPTAYDDDPTRRQYSNSQFYEAIKCCHDNQLQHLSRTADSEEVSVLTKSGRNDDIELATQHLA